MSDDDNIVPITRKSRNKLVENLRLAADTNPALDTAYNLDKSIVAIGYKAAFGTVDDFKFVSIGSFSQPEKSLQFVLRSMGKVWKADITDEEYEVLNRVINRACCQDNQIPPEDR